MLCTGGGAIGGLENIPRDSGRVVLDFATQYANAIIDPVKVFGIRHLNQYVLSILHNRAHADAISLLIDEQVAYR